MRNDRAGFKPCMMVPRQTPCALPLLLSPRLKRDRHFLDGVRSFSAALCWFLVAGVFAAQTDDSELPPFQAVRQTVESHFAEQRDRHSRDLISRSEVEQALDLVKALGWAIDDEREILEKTLPDAHLLVRTLRTPAGRRFMQQVSGRSLMYDRLDRVSTESGGGQLIQDLVKLPDGERYAKPKSGGGVPDLLDLLPKNASGQTRRIPDYHKPTGNLYTVSDLVARLADSHRKASEEKVVVERTGNK